MQSEFSSYVWFPSASASSCTNCFVSCLLCSSSSNTNGLGCPSMSCKGRGIVQSCTDMTCSIDYTGVSYCLITILLSSNSFSSRMLALTGLINLMKSTIPGLVGCCCCCVAQLRRSRTLPAGLAGRWAVNTCSRAFSLIKTCTMEAAVLNDVQMPCSGDRSTYLCLLLLAKCLGERGLCLHPLVEHTLLHLTREDLGKQGDVGLVGKPRAGLPQVVPILHCPSLITFIAREEVAVQTILNLRGETRG